jgi:TP901 family phage tail tape measure protein
LASGRINVASTFDAKGIEQAQRSLKKFSDESRGGMEKFQDSLKKASEVMGRVGTAMTKSVTLPLVGIATAAVKSATEFETSMTKIQSLVGFSAEAVAEFNKEILNMSGRTAKAPKELADALFFATSAGLDAENALLAVESAARASAAGLGETQTIVDLTTSVVNAYGSELIDAAEATDVLTTAVRLGKLEPAQLSSAMGNVLPIASAMGIEFHEVGAAFAAMSRTGTGASEAATQVKGILSSLLKPTQEASQALADVGLSTNDIHKSLREDGLLATLELLVERFDGNASATSAVFGNIRALSGVMDMLGGNAEATREVFAGMNDTLGATDDAFAIASDTAEFKFRQTMADLQATMIDVGNILLPIVGDIVEMFGNLVSKFSELDEGTQKFIVFFGGFVALVGPALILASKVAIAIGGLATAFMKLRTAMMAHPILAAATVITLIATALVAFNGNAKEAKKRTDDFAESLRLVGREKTLNDALIDLVKTNDDFARVLGNSSLSLRDIQNAIEDGSYSTREFQQRLEDAANEAGIFDSRAINPLVDSVSSLGKTFDDASEKNTNMALAMVGTMEHLDALNDVFIEADRQAGIVAHSFDEVAESSEVASVKFQTSSERIADASTATMEKVTEAAEKGAEGFMKANDDMLENADTFIRGLQQQIIDIEKWGDNLATIAQVASADFIEYLASLGPAGATMVADLARNTDKAAEASELWSRRNAAAMTAIQIDANRTRQIIQTEVQIMEGLFLSVKDAAAQLPGLIPDNFGGDLPSIFTPRFSGGPVPGPPSMPVPILAHGGEYVLSADIVDAIRKGAPSRGLEPMAPQSVQQVTSSGPAVVIENYTSIERSDDEMLIGMLEFAVRGGRL